MKLIQAKRNHLTPVVIGFTGIFSLSGCMSQTFVYDVNLKFPETPVCTIPSGIIAYDTKPVKTLNFIVRLQDKAGKPVANQTVIYHYVSDEVLPDHQEVSMFSKMLTTDSLGYVTYAEAPNATILVTGYASASTTTSGTSQFGSFGSAVGFNIGGTRLSFGGNSGSGSSQSQSQTNSAFSLTSQEIDGVVPMPNVKFHGKLQYPSDSGTNGLSEATLVSKNEPVDSLADSSVIRKFEFDVNSNGSNGATTHFKYLHRATLGTQDPDKLGNITPVYGAEKQKLASNLLASSICNQLAPQYAPNQWFPPYTPSGEYVETSSNFPALTTNVNWASKPTCETYVESWIKEATCADNWIRTHVEVFEI